MHHHRITNAYFSPLRRLTAHSHMHVSIIFATYKRNDLLTKTLQGIADADTQGIDWEVIVVDNAGDAETHQTAHRFTDELPLKYLVETSPGKNSALNTALNHAQGDLIIFTDDDIIPDKNWIKSLIAAAGRCPKADIFGGRILPIFPPNTQPPAIDHPFIKSAYVIADWDMPEGEINPERIWGPNMMVRRRLFDQGLRFNPAIGPNGSNYIMGSETEFCVRVAASGSKFIYVPSATVNHHIREEQLTFSWICGRAFRYGRGIAAMDNTPAKRIFNIPRYMLSHILTSYVQYLLSCLRKDKSIKIACAITFHRQRGKIYQYFITKKHRLHHQ